MSALSYLPLCLSELLMIALIALTKVKLIIKTNISLIKTDKLVSNKCES